MNAAIESELERYPYLKSFQDHVIITDADDIKNIKASNALKFGKTTIYSEYIRRILFNDDYYYLAKRYFKNQIKQFKVATVSRGDLVDNIFYSKTQIIRAINEFVKNAEIELTSKQQNRINELKEIVSEEKFLEANNDSIYVLEIDGEKCKFKVSELLNFFNLDRQTFRTLCANKNIAFIGEHKKEQFLYAAYKYVKDSDILDEVLFSENFIDRFNDIKNLQLIDLQAINQCLDPEDETYKKIKLNSELKEHILNGLSKNATDLEKAIYVYIKMCKTFTYDEAYYALEQKGVVDAIQKHKDYNYIAKINKKNNSLVCYEFNTIYAKILSDLGIPFRIDFKGTFHEYGTGHQNITIRCGKFLVDADSIVSILHGDLYCAKVNEPLTGITCANKNSETQREFERTLQRVYKKIIREEQRNSQATDSEPASFEEVLKEYQSTTQNYQEVSIDEKIDIMLKKVTDSKLKGIDALSYLLRLRKVLFHGDERIDNCSISIVRRYTTEAEQLNGYPIAIVAVNNSSLSKEEEQNNYLIFNSTKTVQAISQEELQELFDNREIMYIYDEDKEHRVPGIYKLGEVRKKKN